MRPILRCSRTRSLMGPLYHVPLPSRAVPSDRPTPSGELLQPSARELLADRSITSFLVAAAASSVGMFRQAAALGKHLYDLTDSEFDLGLLGLVEFLPALVLLPLTGSAADRFDRRRVASIAMAAEVVTSLLYFAYAAT